MKIEFSIDLSEFSIDDWGTTITEEIQSVVRAHIRQGVKDALKSHDKEIKKLIAEAGFVSLEEARKILAEVKKQKKSVVAE